MRKNKKDILSLVLFFAILVLFTIVVIDLIPLIEQVVRNIEDETKTIQYLKAYGMRAVPILIALQMLQVAVAFFPAAPIQVLAGLCYGVWWGAVISITGYVLGNMVMFFMLRQFKSNFVQYFPKKEPKKEHKSLFNTAFIKKSDKPEKIAFILYLIPGIPNGILPYIFAETQITYTKYFLSIVLASIPSTLLCSWLGDSLARLNFTTVAILAGVLLVLIVIFAVFKNKIMEKVQNLLEKVK